MLLVSENSGAQCELLSLCGLGAEFLGLLSGGYKGLSGGNG